MTDFVEMHRADGQPDWVNREHIARIQAVEVTEDNWVVKVTLANGMEVVDGHTAGPRADADARLAAILGTSATGAAPPTAGA
jgi:hypothetical protein